MDTMAVVARHQRFAPVELQAIAFDLGIKVRLEPLGDDVSGMLSRDAERGGPSGFEIVINRRYPPSRRQSTFAYELALFILHRAPVERRLHDNELYRSGLPEIEEYQANRLASEILMPKNLIRHQHAAGLSTLGLAQRFNVSEAAMRIRLDTLGFPERTPRER